MRKWIFGIVIWSLILVTTAALAAAVVVPRLTGATPYTVLTGSMRPDLAPGSLVVIRPVAAKDIAIGDVITYQLESGKPAVVTHRVVSIGVDTTGSTAFRTQGDANSSPDTDLIRPVQIRGEVWYSVPHLGHLSNLLTVDQRETAVYIAAAALLGYAIVQWTGALRGRDRAREKNGESQQ